MHTDMKTKMTGNLDAMDDTLLMFVNEMRSLSEFNNVVLLTHSDFGRTLDANANAGSDHGYAGQHIMLGGHVKGKKIHNRYPESVAPDNKQDQGRGRMIPLYPWESMMVPVAQWMGITATADLQDVFPNFANFNSTLLNTDEANKILQTR